MATQTGILLINVGTPDRADPSAVAKYLAEFLMDPWVIGLPYPLRWLLIHGIILRTRPAKSAAAYQKIWTAQGSPLLLHLRSLVQGVQKQVSTQTHAHVRGGMRYGNPSIESAINEFRDLKISRLVIVPLYPQYSLAATRSASEHCRGLAKKILPGVEIEELAPFYQDSGFIQAFAQTAREALQDFTYDRVIFSFHGLPASQVKRTDPTRAHCLVAESCCAQITDANRECYRAQCYASAGAIAKSLGLAPERWHVGFQSRLGHTRRTPWIQPFTDELYRTLPAQGVKRVAVICPSFVADCLETLEEVTLRGREEFIRHGGEELRLVPSLNGSPSWIQALTALVRPHLES